MIVARLHAADEEEDLAIDTGNDVYLGTAPFPGDVVLTAAGQKVRVIRRLFVDHGEPQRMSPPLKYTPKHVDMELDVRLVGECDG